MGEGNRVEVEAEGRDGLDGRLVLDFVHSGLDASEQNVFRRFLGPSFRFRFTGLGRIFGANFRAEVFDHFDAEPLEVKELLDGLERPIEEDGLRPRPGDELG